MKYFRYFKDEQKIILHLLLHMNTVPMMRCVERDSANNPANTIIISVAFSGVEDDVSGIKALYSGIDVDKNVGRPNSSSMSMGSN